MCGSSGGSGDSYAEELRAQEAERQYRIDQGMQELERVFAPLYGDRYVPPGGSTATPVSGSDFGANLSGGEVYGPEIPGSSRTDPERFTSQLEDILGSVDEAGIRRELSSGPHSLPEVAVTNRMQQYFPGEARDQLIDLGLTDTQLSEVDNLYDPDAYRGVLADTLTEEHEQARGGGGRTDDPDVNPIWDDTRTAYLDFATPQLRRQQAGAAEDLTYALARGGQLTGTVGQDRWNDLREDFSLRRQDIAGQAENQAQQRRQDITSTKGNLTSLLESTGNPDMVTQQATDQLTQLTQQPSFESLGPLFQNTTAGLAGGLQGHQQYQTNQQVDRIMGSPYTRDPGRSSGRVVR